MAQGSVERRVWINSASGYVRSILRLGLGVVSFRLLCTELSAEQLGFYGLVWSLLGYGVLFDLGMGVTVQKRTAELVEKQEWTELGKVLSSVLLCNCACSAIIVVVGFGVTDPLLRTIGVSPDNYDDFRWGFRAFILGMGAMGPLEMFREVHYGQQRIAFAEHASTLSGVVSFVLLAIALHLHWRLPVILGLQVTCLVITGIALAISALRFMPRVRIRWANASWGVLRNMARFSALAYIAVVAGIVVMQTDRLLVGAILSVSAVAAYHIGAKVSEIFTAFTKQLPEALAPAAAALHGAGDRASWQRLFVRGIRVNALVTTPLFLLCALFIEGLLRLLTRGRATGSEIVWLGQLLLLWSQSTMLTHGVSKHVFLMSGRESRLVRLLIVEAGANLLLSFLFLSWLKSPLGAALGSLVPAVVTGWVFLWPWAARDIGVTPMQLARETLLPAFRASLPLVMFGATCRLLPALDFRSSLPVFFAESSLAAVLAIVGTWHFGLAPYDRAAIAHKFNARLARTSTVRP